MKEKEERVFSWRAAIFYYYHIMCYSQLALSGIKIYITMAKRATCTTTQKDAQDINIKTQVFFPMCKKCCLGFRCESERLVLLLLSSLFGSVWKKKKKRWRQYFLIWKEDSKMLLLFWVCVHIFVV